MLSLTCRRFGAAAAGADDDGGAAAGANWVMGCSVGISGFSSNHCGICAAGAASVVFVFAAGAC